jgi:hypothetical protein
MLVADVRLHVAAQLSLLPADCLVRPQRSAVPVITKSASRWAPGGPPKQLMQVKRHSTNVLWVSSSAPCRRPTAALHTCKRACRASQHPRTRPAGDGRPR